MKIERENQMKELREEMRKKLLPWWSSCLDRGALNNVEAPGFGTSVVRGPTGHK